MKRSLALGLCVSLLAMPVMATEKDTLKARQDRLSNELEESKKAQAETDAENRQATLASCFYKVEANASIVRRAGAWG